MSQVPRLAVILIAALSICGCATTATRRDESPSLVTKYISAPLTYAIIRRLHKPIYSASVQGTGGEQNVIWSSTLSGGSDYSGPDFESAQTLDAGTYANWKWSIRGSQDVIRSSRLWSHASVSPSERDVAVHDWQSGMQLLYRLSAYLLGGSPRAIDAHVLLIPHGQTYEVQRKQPIASTTQLDFAGSYTVAADASKSTQAERFKVVRRALARLGGQLQHLELATGTSAAPDHEPARAIKNAANSLCWNISVRPALAAYTDASIPGAEAGNSAVEIGAAMYAQHPDSQLALGAYAVLLDLNGAESYLHYRGLEWPKTGRDIDDINGLLEYCRALIQYRGDITRNPLPVNGISAIPFFTHKVDVGEPMSAIDGSK